MHLVSEQYLAELLTNNGEEKKNADKQKFFVQLLLQQFFFFAMTSSVAPSSIASLEATLETAFTAARFYFLFLQAIPSRITAFSRQNAESWEGVIQFCKCQPLAVSV